MNQPAALQLPEVLTHAEAPAAVRDLGERLRANGRAGAAAWSIDASRLKRFDSSALAVLLECRRIAAGQGNRIEVHGAPPKLGQLARLYRLDELLPMPGPAQAGSA